jgi:hypothetical protein
VSWKPGVSNLADFFTKAHPVYHHKAMRENYVDTPRINSPRINASFRRKSRRQNNSKGVLAPLYCEIDAPMTNCQMSTDAPLMHASMHASMNACMHAGHTHAGHKHNGA